jgi:putative nucleotidyltransferase with HDIG domain
MGSVTSPSKPSAPEQGAVATLAWWTSPGGLAAGARAAFQATQQEQILATRVEKQTTLGHFRIPQIPEVAARAVALLAQQDVDANDVSRLIHQDQQLAADVIAFSNSSLFAGTRKTTNIPDAINRVGFRRTRSLIFAASLRSVIYGGCEVARAEELWRHSVGCASFAARIAHNVRQSADDAYLAGLFHDVGKTVVLSVLDTIALRAQQLPLRTDFVEHMLACHHERVGAEVARHWNLPEHVCDAIRNHTADHDGPVSIGQAIVCLANNVCRRLNVGEQDDGRPIASKAVLAALGAEERDLPQLLDGVRETVFPG